MSHFKKYFLIAATMMISTSAFAGGYSSSSEAGQGAAWDTRVLRQQGTNTRAQVLQLQGEIDAIEAQISTLSRRREAEPQNAAALTNEIGELRAEQRILEMRMANLENEVDVLHVRVNENSSRIDELLQRRSVLFEGQVGLGGVLFAEHAATETPSSDALLSLRAGMAMKMSQNGDLGVLRFGAGYTAISEAEELEVGLGYLRNFGHGIHAGPMLGGFNYGHQPVEGILGYGSVDQGIFGGLSSTFEVWPNSSAFVGIDLRAKSYNTSYREYEFPHLNGEVLVSFGFRG